MVSLVRRLAVISMHTSPLAQPGSGDGGGMNVYVRELSSALARAGVACDVFTRAESVDVAEIVNVEPGLRVHHVPAGPLGPVAKEALPGLVDEFTESVLKRMTDAPPDAIHANYWLSGVAGHVIKHRLDLPLVCTFHTLDRVKADDSEDSGRAEAEAHIIGCSDAVLASCTVEADQLADLYDADPTRIEIVAPGVDHAFFSPGHRPQARRALGLPATGPMLLFVGRIQPLKGLEVAVRALALLDDQPEAFLVVVGGPSGPQGEDELQRIHALVDELGLTDRVRFLPPQAHELLSTYYRAADVCLVPSRSESFGLVALEAAACGTPVVAAAVGGLRTLIDHGHTGFLVEGRDPRAFAAFTAEILDSPALAAEMAISAAARARRYTWSIAAGRLRRLYGDLTAKALVECP
ncbi:MAG: D-inositol-3-phosphate glycosyltransferase [Actinomycetota bacterium]|nr:D-inositol-3-phosphate glycosyltransferase [Actinomycetota bacterium]